MASREESVADAMVRRTDLRRAMARLRPRERALLWLAYAQEHPHAEIAVTLGVETGSVKLLLFRARRRLAQILRSGKIGTARRTSPCPTLNARANRMCSTRWPPAAGRSAARQSFARTLTAVPSAPISSRLSVRCSTRATSSMPTSPYRRQDRLVACADSRPAGGSAQASPADRPSCKAVAACLGLRRSDRPVFPGGSVAQRFLAPLRA